MERTEEALAELRRARRRRRLAHIDFVDALYRVYLTALGAVAGTLWASGLLPSEPAAARTVEQLSDEGPAVLGALFALAVAFGLRSGARGGPLTLEPPTVIHELLAPVDRRLALAAPTLKHLRFIAWSGAIVGACVGYLAARRLPEDSVMAVITTAGAFAVAALGASGAALVAAGRRLSPWVAFVVGVALLGWSGVDVGLGVRTSPSSLLGEVAFWGLTWRPTAFVGVGVFLLLGAAGTRVIGGMSIEAARRRAGLVSELRFAATMQDVRTVVLLRRQLAQERPRRRPWISLGRRGRNRRLPPAWRRDWQSILRFPFVRLARMATLAGVAGLALGFTWQGATPVFLVAAAALYLIAYDAVEPLAQEVDHPARWDSYPAEHGRLLTAHLPAAVVLMVVPCLVAAAAALVLVPAPVVGELALAAVVPVALTATVAAAVSTSLGAPDTARLIGMGADMMGVVLLARLAVPPIVVALSLVPLLTVGTDPTAVDAGQVFGMEQWLLLVVAGGVLWLRSRSPERL